MESSIYETQCVQLIIKSLQKQNSSLSSKYCDAASRKFYISQHLQAFQQAKLLLQNSDWQSLDNGSLDFDNIQIDCLLHTSQNQSLENTKVEQPLAVVTVPKRHKIRVEEKPFLRKMISEAAIADEESSEPNCYVVIEITLDPSRLKNKLAQLERDLTVLLCRQRINQNCESLHITEIVQYAGIVSKKNLEMGVQSHFQEYQKCLPLLYILWQVGRVIVAKIKPKSMFLI